jgi:hypothetical protein
VIIPRIGAIFLLIGYGFAVAQVGRLLYVTASEGYSSWIAALLFLLPTGILGLASALLVLWRKPLGVRLALPFCVLLFATAVIVFFGAPPAGGFLDDYEQASLERGVNVPNHLEEQGVTEAEHIEDETDDVRAQGALGAIAVIIVYAATVLRGSRARPKQAGANA